jgi:hypothetical protein
MTPRIYKLDLYSAAFLSRLNQAERPIAVFRKRFIITALDSSKAVLLDIREWHANMPHTLFVWDGHTREVLGVIEARERWKWPVVILDRWLLCLTDRLALRITDLSTFLNRPTPFIA